MAEFPSMPFWTDAYLADTTHLTTTEHGAYLLLLIAMWRTSDKRLPNDDHRLARYAKLTSGQWARMRSTIMEFFRSDGDWITQGRLTDEATLVKLHSRSQSDKARARWLKNNNTTDAVALPDECRSDAPTPTPTPTSTDSSLRSESSPPETRADRLAATLKEEHRATIKRATRLSPNWTPDEECHAFAVELDLDPGAVLMQFRDYWLAKPTNATKLDWNATWRSWCRRDAERRDERGGRGSNRQAPGGLLAAAGAVADRLRRSGR
jgi:uncharacterized protein YdaU (DUF1376 family)